MLAKKEIYIKKKPLIFSRWSRKSWAVFCSLGSEVKIAVLKLVVANGFIKKNEKGSLFIEETKKIISDDDGPDEMADVFKYPVLSLLSLLQPQKMIVCGGSFFHYFKKHISNNKMHPFLSGKDFLFLMPENLIIKNSINRGCHAEVLVT